MLSLPPMESFRHWWGLTMPYFIALFQLVPHMNSPELQPCTALIGAMSVPSLSKREACPPPQAAHEHPGPILFG